MTIQKIVTTDDLATQIQACSQRHFTGRLDIEDPQHQNSWSLDFSQGYLIGCETSQHSMRSWWRHLFIHFPKLFPPNWIAQRRTKPMDWENNFLADLVQHKQVSRQQIAEVLASQVVEILFDIHQYSGKLYRSSKQQLIYQRRSKSTIDSKDAALVLIAPVYPWQQATQAWEAWNKAGLADYSPNLAPIVLRSEELRQQTSQPAYSKINSLADGNWTLRDLAIRLKQQLLPLTKSIMPYVYQGLMALIEVEDLTNQATLLHSVPTSPLINQGQPQPISPLVACIDDNQNDNLRMSQILTASGYRFIKIQNPLQALLILLDHKPDFIFLDLVMPIANGYEICAQIRRISAFKNTPIIILTNNDGIVDRVRAKMVGASGFLSKPIEAHKVLKTIQKYLVATAHSQQ